jgi:uncharacterized protein (DUF58 family)
MNTPAVFTPSEWQGSSGRVASSRYTWNRLLWSLVYPQKRHRVTPTLPGTVLITLSLGLGVAAYNASNNILFITLSLLLGCLILSGVLSWLNFRGVEWKLQVEPPLRSGQAAVVRLLIRNTKRMLPTYSLQFDLAARMVDRRPPARAETTLSARGIDVRSALARSGEADAKVRLPLRRRLGSGEVVELEWTFQPARRGILRVELDAVGSLFPFGFLQKQIRAGLHADVPVWAPRVEYRRSAVTSTRRSTGGKSLARTGGGNDLLALRRYQIGDSHRAIHWKASARMNQLLVRQFAAENSEGYALWVLGDPSLWAHGEQFELMLGMATTLAEDLFRTGALQTVALDQEAPRATRRLRDLETFLDRLAALNPWPVESEVLAPVAPPLIPSARSKDRRQVITFHPDGARGVTAWVGGAKIAAL